MLNIVGFISEIFQPAADLIDSVHTSTEEKLEAKAKLATAQNEILLKLADVQKTLVEAQAKIITAEAQGDSWLQRNWRPVTMITFLILVVLDSVGVLPNRLSSEAWTLLQIGLGGYVVSRGAEKVTNNIKQK